MIKALRKKLKPYGEIFYMLYFLPLAGCVAMGISSAQTSYRLVFAGALLFLLLKFFITDYNKKELFFIITTMALLGYVFSRTREKALLLTALSIFGCKDVSVNKVIKYTVFVYIIGMGLTISLVLLGKVPGEIHQLSKNGITYSINDYGFSHPNSAYSHILMISIMGVAVWHERMRWYHYVVMSVAMLLAYKVFLSRTGLLIYLLLCVMLVLCSIIKQEKVKKVFFFPLNLVPLGIAVFSYFFSIMYSGHIWYIDKLNDLVTNRILFSSKALNDNGLSWFGHVVVKSWNYYIDNAYINVLLSYGIFVMILWILSYTFMCYKYWEVENYILLLVMVVLAIYAFMEYSPINVTWNPLLLFMSVILFGNMKKENSTSAP
ncbi:hypothetical protein [Lacrimispora sp.]|uniref:hypothetical protein n=1 Tax=Lacrimispora sp. TaxID=2719234 RepID=UPI0032E38FF7